eukprot:PITA_34797
MKDGDSVTEHLNAFNTVVSQLLSVDIKISDEDKCIILLCSLPDSWLSLFIAIGSNSIAFQFDEIVSSLLSEEMRQKNMEGQNGDSLSVQALSQNINKNNSSCGISKSRGRFKSPGKPLKVCWKCGKEGNFKRDYKSKAPKKGKGFGDAPSTKVKTTSGEVGDVYLDSSSSTHVDHEAWSIDSGESFHFTPHREWFYEYEKYDGGDVFLRDERKARIDGCEKFKLKLQGGRTRTLSGVLHIPELAKNLISVSNLDDARVKIVFEKDTCKMVRGALELEKIEFELKEEESDSTTEEESKDEELETLAMRRSIRETRQPERYSPSAFCSNFTLSITDDDPRTVREVVDSKDGKLWKKVMVDEITYLHKNEAWYLVELSTGRKRLFPSAGNWF